MTNLEVVDCIEVLRIILGTDYPVAYAETILVVDEELDVALVALVELVILMQHVVEERLAQLTWLDIVETGWIEDVGIVHVDDSRLLWELLFAGIKHVNQASLLEIREVVDHSGTAGLDALGQKADVRRTWSLLSKDMKQLLELWKVRKLNLLEEEDVDLKHGVHVLDKHLRVVLLLKEERIESVMDIILEVVERLDL